MPCPATKRAAVLLIETDSISVIGPTGWVIRAAQLKRRVRDDANRERRATFPRKSSKNE